MKSRDTIISLVLAVAFSALYAVTLCRSVFLGDSGELTTAARLLDIPHPPGYPLFTLLGRLFSLFPIGSIAARVNLLSAIFGAGSVVFLYRLARIWAGAIPSLGAAILFGIAPIVWSQCVIAEVYTLFLFLFFAAMFLLMKTGDGRALPLAGYLGGLAIAAHPIGIAILPLLLLSLSLKREGNEEGRRSGLKNPALPLLLAILGLTTFLYLPIRSLLDPPTDWGNPETFRGFLAHISRFQYRDVPHPERSVLLFLRQTSAGFRMLLGGNVPAPLIPLLPVGFVAVLLRRKREDIILIVSLLILGPALVAFLAYPLAPERVAENQVFLLPFLALILILLAVSMETVLSFLSGKRTLRVAIALLPLLVAALRFPAILPQMHYDRCTLPDTYARQALTSLPRGANLVATGDDIVFPLLYLHEATGIRPDVTLYNRGGSVLLPWLPERERLSGEVAYFTWPEEGTIPSGLLYRTEQIRSLSPPTVVPSPISERLLMNYSHPLRALWINYMETLARSTPDVAEAARYRSEAIGLSGEQIFCSRECQVHYAEAAVRIDRDDLPGAEELLRRLIQMESDCVPARLLLAELLLQNKERAEAASLADLTRPESARAYTRSAAILLYCGERESGESHLREAVRLDPFDTAALEQLQGLAAADQNWDEAVALGARTLAIDPALPVARLLLARARLARGEREEARRQYELLLEIAPRHPAAVEAEAFLSK